MMRRIQYSILFLVVLSGLIACTPAQIRPKVLTFPSREIIFRKSEEFDLKLNLPRRAKPDRISMKLAGERLTETQRESYLDKFLHIGDVYTEVKGYVSGKLVINHMELESPVIFYLSHSTEYLSGLTITPVEEVVGEARRNSGETQNRYYLDVMQVDEAGATEGVLLKRVSDIRLELGVANHIPLDVSSAKETFFAMKMGLEGKQDQDNEDDYLIIQAKGGGGRFILNLRLFASPTYRYLWNSNLLSDPDITIQYGSYPTDLEIRVKGKSIWKNSGGLTDPIDLDLPLGDVEGIIDNNSKMNLTIYNASSGLVKIEDIKVRFK